jgi:DNA-binding NarL/FixJ family response regulator
MNILLVDDHPLIRDGVAALLSRHDPGTRVRCAADCASGIALAVHEAPDLILLDLGLPDRVGMAALDVMREAVPGVPVAVLSGTLDRDVVMAAIDHGACGYIPIWAALGVILSGGVYVPDCIVGIQPAPLAGPVVAGNPQTVTDVLAAHGLTGRQRDILRALVAGHSNKEIARRLDLAEPTVKAHVSAVLRALNVGSRTQAVLWLGRHGIAAEDL